MVALSAYDRVRQSAVSAPEDADIQVQEVAFQLSITLGARQPALKLYRSLRCSHFGGARPELQNGRSFDIQGDVAVKKIASAAHCSYQS